MAANDIATYLKYTNLQMAAEAFLVDETTGQIKSGNDLVRALKVGNNHSLIFPDAVAKDFASKYTVVAQRSNTGTGFSGTLFRDNQSQELTLSFRSTEFIDDAVQRINRIRVNYLTTASYRQCTQKMNSISDAGEAIP